jgi:hypothetical protein
VNNEKLFKEDYIVVYAARMGKMGNEYNILVGKSNGKKSLGKPISRLGDNVKISTIASDVTPCILVEIYRLF